MNVNQERAMQSSEYMNRVSVRIVSVLPKQGGDTRENSSVDHEIAIQSSEHMNTVSVRITFVPPKGVNGLYLVGAQLWSPNTCAINLTKSRTKSTAVTCDATRTFGNWARRSFGAGS